MIELTKDKIKSVINNHFNKDELKIIIEQPKKPELGDFSIPAFVLAKQLQTELPKVALEIKECLINLDLISEVNIMGGFINIKLDRTQYSNLILNSIDSKYGSSTIGENKTIVIDYSAPNIAKSFGIGHLRSTIIGHSLKKIYQKSGYNVVGINHLGDWGTQFGKLIYAFKTWSSDEELIENPIKELMRIYVKFHIEVESDPTLEDKGRLEFKKLEDGDQENLKLWEHFRKISLKEFEDMYELLGVSFDSYNGEAFYNDKMSSVVEELENKQLLSINDGATIVDLGEDIIPALIKKSDGSTLYLTRDLAAILYRMNEYNFEKCLYVVGKEQSLHFKQLKMVLDKMKHSYSNSIDHVNFGLYLTDGKKMSTRNGKSVKLIDVIEESCSLALKYIEEKNPTLEDKKDIANKVGISAIIFNDLKNDRTNNIEFNLENIVKFEGQTGPYLQYTTVRIKSILKSCNYDSKSKVDSKYYTSDSAYELIKEVGTFPMVIRKAVDENSPHHISKLLLSIATKFNSFYANERINAENDIERNTKLRLICKVLEVMQSGFDLLGIKQVDKM